MTLENAIRKYLADNVLYLDDGFEYANDTSLIGEGLIDSMGIMELVAYVRTEFGVDVQQRDVVPDNFDSVEKLVAYIRRKSQSRSSVASR